VRDDLMELFNELGFSEEHQAAKDFLQRGDGQLEEHRRLSGVGLQECVTLLSRISTPAEGGLPKVGEDAVEKLRKKVQRASTVLDGASALRQVLQTAPGSSPQPSAAGAGQTDDSASGMRQPGAVAQPAARMELDEGDEDELDEAQHRRLELARLQRIEEGLLTRLERFGSLSPAEESRLHDVREQLTRL